MAEQMYGEKVDGRGKHMLVPISDFRKQAYLDWLCTPMKEREHKTKEALAGSLGLTRRTLTNWSDDKEFLEAFEKRYLKTIGDPGRKQEIMDVLYRIAAYPDVPKHVQAAKQYFEIEGSIKPAKMQVEVTRPAKDLTDDELDAILADKIASERSQRAS